jgi:phosphohistidine phosphatase
VLTDKGRRDVRRVAEHLRKTKTKVDLVLTSPYVRARQTAEIAAQILRVEIAESRHLTPSADPQKLWLELAQYAGKTVMLAGHEPNMSALVHFLLGAEFTIDFKKGGVVRIETDDPPAEPKGILKWMLTPRLSVR